MEFDDSITNAHAARMNEMEPLMATSIFMRQSKAWRRVSWKRRVSECTLANTGSLREQSDHRPVYVRLDLETCGSDDDITSSYLRALNLWCRCIGLVVCVAER